MEPDEEKSWEKHDRNIDDEAVEEWRREGETGRIWLYKMGYADVNNAKHVVSGEEW